MDFSLKNIRFRSELTVFFHGGAVRSIPLIDSRNQIKKEKLHRLTFFPHCIYMHMFTVFADVDERISLCSNIDFGMKNIRSDSELSLVSRGTAIRSIPPIDTKKRIKNEIASVDFFLFHPICM
jgi:hypothetical protein